jgi:hypothetical protein
MKKLIIIILSLSAIINHAQTNSKSIIQNAVNNTAVQSPNAAALFRYSETPVSLYTGVPDISIPIYTIKEGDIEVPISISYHAGGIKVNDEASSVGLGWNLNAGGRVSHIMTGANDFSMYGYYNIYPRTANGFVGSISGCPSPTWNNSSAVSSFYTNNFRLLTDYYSGTTYTGFDFQPDLFLINLPNNTYKAYLDMTKTTKTDYPKFAIADQPNINLKLIPYGGGLYVPGTEGMYNFTVVDNKGLTYSFDGAREFSAPVTNTIITGTSNYLTQITDPNGKKIKFSYTPTTSYANRLAGCRTTRYSYTYPPNDPANPHWTNASQGLTQCTKQAIHESYVEKIEFTNGRVEFTWSDREDLNNSKKLSSIRIYNNYKLIKQYDFNYDYLIATDNLNTSSLVSWLGTSNDKVFTYRLRLLSLTESLTNERYSFDYNSVYNLPNKLSFSSDFWGYYNGQTNSDSFIPDPDKYIRGQSPFTVNSFNQDQSGYWYNAQASSSFPAPEMTYVNFTSDNKHYLADRRASLQALAGILTGITYPTGGKTEFEYELNTFSNYPIQSLLDNANTGLLRDYSFGGGVRIKNIKTLESTGSIPIIKNYVYDELNEAGTKFISNGKLSEFPKFYEIENRCYIQKMSPTFLTILSNTSCINTFTVNVGFQDHPFKVSVYEGAQSQGTSTLPQGGLVGYNKVIEQITGKGRTESYFTNGYSPSCLSMIPRGSASIIGNGDLVKLRHYDNSNALIKETMYNYKFNYPDNLNTYFISGAILEPVNTLTPEFTGIDINYPAFGGLIHTYSINLYKSLLESTTTKEYFPAGSGNYTETKTLTTYNNKYLPSIQKTTYPDTSISETTYNYAQEKGNQLMMSKNMVEIPLETISTQTNNGITKTLSKTETVYPTSLPDTQIGNFILPKSVKSYDLSNNNSITEVTLDKYDATGNLIQFTTKESIPVTIVWGYNNSQPIAKVEGTTYDQLVNSGLISTIISASDLDASNPGNESALITALDSFRNNSVLSGYQISTYTYDPLIGVTSITPPSGIREVYIYDTANRLKEIRENNATGKLLKEFKYNYKN